MAAGYGPSNVTINIILQPVPGEAQSFTTTLHLVDQVNDSLDGDRYRTYTSSQDATDDLASGFISAATNQALQDAFSQIPRPPTILLGRVDTVGVETYSDGLDAVIAAGANFYGITADTRTATDQITISANIEARNFYIYGMQSSDVDWLTATYPAAYSTVENRERTFTIYHDTDTEWADLCWVGQRLFFDPDTKSAAWPANLKEVANNSTDPTTSQQALALVNEVNIGLEWASASYWISPGVNANNRPIEFIVTVDWFQTRLNERTTALFQDSSARGEKIIVNQTGQAQILSLLNGLVQEGLTLGHLDTAEASDGTILPRTEAKTITAADKVNQELRFDAELLWATAGQAVTYNLYFQQTVS